MTTSTRRFAHLTDLHFTTFQQNRYPTGPLVLERAIADLNEQDLDFVLLTGDMFHFPERVALEIETFRELLSGLNCPYYLAFGNHDVEGHDVAPRKQFLMRELGDHGLSAGSPYYAVRPVPGLRLIVLDSTDTDEPDYLTWRGRFTATQADWLHETLAEQPDELTILGIHHPPVTPYPLMGALKFEEADRKRLAGAIAPHRHAPLLLCGHYHLSSSSSFSNTTVLTGPSLVEHPHQYRVFEIDTKAGGHDIHFHWRQVPLDEREDAPCAIGTAMRHMALNRLSYAKRGSLSVALSN
jgi:3',5'-cyclic AMP phosphodiesterase CpdA